MARPYVDKPSRNYNFDAQNTWIYFDGQTPGYETPTMDLVILNS